MIDCAADLAKRLHKGHETVSGEDYFEKQLCPVAEMCVAQSAKTMAYLYDAAEYSGLSEEQIVAMLADMVSQHDLSPIPKTVQERLVAALKLFDKNRYSSHEDYLKGFLKDAAAMFVLITALSNEIKLLKLLPSSNDNVQNIDSLQKDVVLLRQWFNDPALW